MKELGILGQTCSRMSFDTEDTLLNKLATCLRALVIVDSA